MICVNDNPAPVAGGTDTLAAPDEVAFGETIEEERDVGSDCKELGLDRVVEDIAVLDGLTINVEVRVEVLDVSEACSTVTMTITVVSI